MKYWIRQVFADTPCIDSEPCADTLKVAFRAARSALENKDVRYVYIMKKDAFGECFAELVRRESLDA
jgi:hypothetical protein